MKIPSALEASGWNNPSGDPIVFKAAFGQDQNASRWLREHPETLEDFNALMVAQRATRRDWYDFFPVKEQLLAESDEESPLLVDMSGAQGYELDCFRQRFPDAKGSLVLQELPQAIAQVVDLHPSIECTEHDFFTPQPVLGEWFSHHRGAT